MASFLIASQQGQAAPLAARMEAEGAEVAFYVHDERYRAIYEGGMCKRPLSPARLRRLLTEVPEGMIAILDGTAADALSAAEREILGLAVAAEPLPAEPSCSAPAVGDEEAGFWGQLAALLAARGARVYGASPRAEQISASLSLGLDLARELGMEVVDTFAAQSAEELDLYLRTRETPCVVRADAAACAAAGRAPAATYAEERPGDLLRRLRAGLHPELRDAPATCLLHPLLAGIPYREEAWWDGERFLHHGCSLELGHLWPGSRGPVVESAATLTWMLRRPLVPWERLADVVRGWGCYRGPVSVRFLIADGAPVVLRVLARPVYDALYGWLSLLWCPISDFFANDLFGGLQVTDFAATLRASVPPYPFSAARGARPFEAGAPVVAIDQDFWAVDVRQALAGTELAGTSGLAGVAVGVDSDPGSALRRALRSISRTHIAAPLVYRDDVALLEDGWRRLRAMALAS